RPAHTVCFDKPFWVDRTEATVSQFADFLNGQTEPVNNIERWLYKPIILPGIQEPNDQLVQNGTTWEPIGIYGQHPIGHITWIGATDYCAWREARLPTEAEWEYSARSPESFIYPWGNEYIPDNVVRRRVQNSDVGSKPQGASWVGALDLSGSLFEWTSSLYMPYPYDENDGREVSFEEDSLTFRVFRGSAWYHDIGVDDVSASPRFEGPLNYGYSYHGFRCARSLD
ncbi:MAG: formylglycine-generating enzyme family protein, partial [Methanosarcinaceae archaeon]|nr:formylglycine-generating enzyme family protein [Methanosarcinaceae archaeon]